MARATFGGLTAAVLLAAGCAQSPEPYLTVFAEQRAAWKEMASILAKVEDEKTLAEAKTNLDERLGRFEEIARKAKALPRPSAEVLKRLDEERFSWERAGESLRSEVARVRGLNLKGGPEFFKHFESKDQNLFQAVQS